MSGAVWVLIAASLMQSLAIVCIAQASVRTSKVIKELLAVNKQTVKTEVQQ